MDRTPPVNGPDSAGFAISALLFAVALLILWDAGTLQLSATYGIGPKAMPYVVGSGLIVLAVGNLLLAWRRNHPLREQIDPRAIFLILGGLAALIAIIGLGGGFIIATSLLFATTAAAFGRRAFLADLGIGIVLAVTVYLLFDKLLTLSLPAGPLERLI